MNLKIAGNNEIGIDPCRKECVCFKWWGRRSREIPILSLRQSLSVIHGDFIRYRPTEAYSISRAFEPKLKNPCNDLVSALESRMMPLRPFGASVQRFM